MRLPLGLLGFAVFVAFATLFGPFPVLTPYSRALGASAALAAWVVSVYSLTNLVGNGVAGVLIARRGAAPVLRLGLVLTALTTALYAVALTPRQLLAARAAHGFAAAWVVPAAFALAAALLPAERRGRGMGRLGAPIGLAAVVAPPLAGLLADAAGHRSVFLALGALVAAGALASGRLAASPQARAAHRDATAWPGREARLYLGSAPLWRAWAAGFGLPFNLGVLAWYLPTAAADLGLPGAAAGGAALGLMALVAAALMAGPAGAWADRAGRGRPLELGLASLAAAMLLWGGPSPALFFAGAAVFGVGFGMIFPAANALIADAMPQAARGLGFAGFYAWFSVGTALAPPLSERLAAGAQWSPFLTGAVVALATAVLARALGGGKPA